MRLSRSFRPRKWNKPRKAVGSNEEIFRFSFPRQEIRLEKQLVHEAAVESVGQGLLVGLRGFLFLSQQQRRVIYEAEHPSFGRLFSQGSFSRLCGKRKKPLLGRLEAQARH